MEVRKGMKKACYEKTCGKIVVNIRAVLIGHWTVSGMKTFYV